MKRIFAPYDFIVHRSSEDRPLEVEFGRPTGEGGQPQAAAINAAKGALGNFVCAQLVLLIEADYVRCTKIDRH